MPHRVPGEQAGLVDVAPTNQVASPEHVSVADVLSNGAEAPTPLRGGRMAKEDTVPGATPAAGRACGGGTHFQAPLSTPNCSPGGVGSWAGMQLGPQDIQRRWRICCRSNKRVIWIQVERADLSALAWAFARFVPTQVTSLPEPPQLVLCPSVTWPVGFFPSPSA